MAHRSRAVVVSILLVALAVSAQGTVWAQEPPPPSPSPSPHASPTPDAGPTPHESPTPQASPSPEPSPTDDAPHEGLEVAVAASRIVAQVGRGVEFTIKLSNASEQTARDVVVIGLVPPEVRVTAVPVLDEVDAVQLGEHRGRQDIVWVLSELGPASSLELAWAGEVRSSGDLVAEHAVEVKSQDIPMAAAAARLYLARVSLGPSSNPPVRVQGERVVSPVAVSEGSAGSPLPATGLSPFGFIALGLALMGAGRLLWRVGSGRTPAAAGLVVAVAVLTAGCVSSPAEPPETRRGPPALSSEGEDGAAEVRGRRVARERPGERSDARDDGEASDQPVVAGRPGGAEPAPRVETVVTEAADLPLVALTRRLVSGHAGVVWDEHAGSPALDLELSREGLTFSLAASRRALDAIVSLTTPDDARRTSVKGRLVYEIQDGPAPIRLFSPVIDVVLNPEGSVSARFEHRLPSGAYVVRAFFEPLNG